ncbi:MAG TPA: Mut7-C RNAse domain-containing protein [Nitrososphaera sp.]|nr:Mut7-C RNAse domain-containing protein [Nitrososphaera sp.]
MKAHSSAKYVEARPALIATSRVTFLADAMLGSLARKLRIFGFDTLYIAHTHDDEILRVGIEQGRVILTADKELFKRIVKVGARGVLVSGDDELEDIVHIMTKIGITSVDFASSRCSVCNGPLARRTPMEIRSSVPGKVSQCHDEFYQCEDCSKVYWEGSHFRRIRALTKNVDSRLGSAVS